MDLKTRKKQQGFTLIEIIAVLIILGILSAVAVPKYMDLQEQAEQKALDGACAAAASQFTMSFSSELLRSNGDVNASLHNVAALPWDLGDFNATDSNPTFFTLSDNSSSVDITVQDKNGKTKVCTIPNPGYNG